MPTRAIARGHRLTLLIWFGLVVATASIARGQSAEGPYDQHWESLISHATPEWLADAKFGIYAHWGIYSVPAYGNEWYAKRMYDKRTSVYRHHVEAYGNPSRFGYKDFIDSFDCKRYDPKGWARLIADSGAKYAGIVVVHHDGFLLWGSDVNRWNAGKMGPRGSMKRGEQVNHWEENSRWIRITGVDARCFCSAWSLR